MSLDLLGAVDRVVDDILSWSKYSCMLEREKRVLVDVIGDDVGCL